MSRSIHETKKGVFGGKSKSDIDAMCEEPIDGDVEALVRKSEYKRQARDNRKMRREQDGAERAEDVDE